MRFYKVKWRHGTATWYLKNTVRRSGGGRQGLKQTVEFTHPIYGSRRMDTPSVFGENEIAATA